MTILKLNSTLIIIKHNCNMNEAFLNLHSNQISFIQTIEKRSSDRVDGLERLRRENLNKVLQEEVNILEILASHYPLCL